MLCVGEYDFFSFNPKEDFEPYTGILQRYINYARALCGVVVKAPCY
jgi:hypothetical protein